MEAFVVDEGTSTAIHDKQVLCCPWDFGPDAIGNGRNKPKFRLGYGSGDTKVWLSEREALISFMERGSAEVDLHVLDGETHFRIASTAGLQILQELIK